MPIFMYFHIIKSKLIYTVQGIEVKRISGINSTITEFEKGNLKTGIYFYSVFNALGLVKGSGKLIVNSL